MTFTEKQQKEHRVYFINECRQKAWGAACHADWISKSVDKLLAHYQKLQAEDLTLEADSKELASALDAHTVDNREKRKAIQGRRDQLTQQMQATAQSAQQGQKAMQQLLQSVESNLELAKHAEDWKWKEVETKLDDQPETVDWRRRS
jgi:DNA anti-recombination protein RmuC